MKSELIQASDPQEQLEAATRMARALQAGEVVIMPTETVYGVAACVTRCQAMNRLRQIKGRPAGGKPFSVHIGRKADAEHYVNRMPPVAERIIRKGWPGPLALVLPVEEPAETPIARVVGRDLLDEIFHERTIGLRCPDDPVTTRALAEVGEPVVAASANRPGNAPPATAQEAIRELGDEVDLIIDTGATRYTKPSTIVKVAGDGRWEVLRSGVLDARAVRRLASKTILLVCSGNTCRSPMAEALCQARLSETLGVSPDKLADAGYEVLSAGAATGGGAPASDNAIEACRREGMDISGHRSRPLTPDLIRQADVIWTMCRHHSDAVIRLVPEAKNKVERLDPGQDISDPAGADAEHYAQCLRQIRTALEARSRDMV